MLINKFTSEKIIKIALVGQPNVGKSMLINSISNSKLRVGNFPGVTVEKKQINFVYDGYKFIVTDLPGAYSLNDYTLEEKVTKEYLEKEEYDIILNVLDSTNLQRNLYLTSELLALEEKVVLALNMSDEARDEGIKIDVKHLSNILGQPCVETSAKERTGTKVLLETIIKKHQAKKTISKLTYSTVIEEEALKIINYLEEKKYKSTMSYKKIAIELLKENKNIYTILHKEPIFIELQLILSKSLNHIYTHFNTKNVEDIFSDEQNSFARGVVKQTQIKKNVEKKDYTSKIDSILIHKYFGIPIFLIFMWSLFQLTFEIGSIPMEYIDQVFALLIDKTKEVLGDNDISSMIADGAIAGVGAVVLFVPNIIILFFGISLLETTGYMSRVAFLLDGFFHKFGLHGKSFIPLVSGFGCSVPAYMAARTLKNERDRLLTLFIIGFMSCGAKLPIFVLFIGAFFAPEDAGNVLFIIYISGALFGLFAAKVLKVVVFKNEDEPFVMEMPKYRLPSAKLVWHSVSGSALMYLKKAGTYILLASIIIWFASNYPKHLDIQEEYRIKIENINNESKKQELQNEFALYKLENSYLGKIGKFSEPFFAPLGYDWKMSVALETGLAAKEIVVATLGILYGLGEENDENSNSLINKIKTSIPFASAISFLVFCMIYLPCLAASMVFAREAGGFKYLVYLFVFTSVTAWTFAYIAYNITLALN